MYAPREWSVEVDDDENRSEKTTYDDYTELDSEDDAITLGSEDEDEAENENKDDGVKFESEDDIDEEMLCTEGEASLLNTEDGGPLLDSVGG